MLLENLALLKSRCPELHALLDCPGAFDSQFTRSYFLKSAETRLLMEFAESIRHDSLILLGAKRKIEEIVRSGLFRSLRVSAFCPDVHQQTKIEAYTLPGADVFPLVAFSPADSTVPVLCLDMEVPASAAGMQVTNIREQYLLHEESGHIADFLDNAFAQRKEQIERVASTGDTVLFAGNIDYFNFMRISECLRARGMKTILLSLTGNILKFKSNSFDLTIEAFGNLELFFRLMNAVPFFVVHFQGWMMHHHYAAAAAFLCRSPILVDLNDLPHLFMKAEDFDALFGQNMFQRETIALRHILEQADVVIANCGKSFLNIFADMVKPSRQAPLYPFHMYPHAPFFYDASTWNKRSVVFPGSLPPSCFPPEGFAGSQLLALIKKYVIPQGMEYHIYSNPFGNDDTGWFWDYKYYARKEPKFVLHGGLPPDALLKEISGYGFGGMFYLLEEHCNVLADHYNSIVPTKAMTMLEAGLPLLYSEEFQTLDTIVAPFGAGIKVSQQDIRSGLSRVVDSCDYPKLREGVRALREALSLDSKIADLIAMYSAARRNNSRNVHDHTL